MALVKHRFINHSINPRTETLIIGTFNPESEKNPADFFYGRSRNYLWTLVPKAYGENDLKGKRKEEKLNFLAKYKIDFIDLISEVEVEEESNYYDGYLDKRVKIWRNVISEIEKLTNLKKVCFTRISFSDIPEMQKKIEEIRDFCKKNKILFQYLPTPARFYREDKQIEWSKFFLNDN
jgi:G:T/U-mismatch repair DNA glycosylase